MNEGLSVLVTLTLLSALLSMILLIVWGTMGRARHALTWAVAFGVATLQWAFNICDYLVGGRITLFLTVNALAVLVAGLIALGFRQRAGRGDHWRGLLSGGMVTIAVIVVATLVYPHAGVTRSMPLLYRAIVLAMAAAVVVPPGQRANAAERSVVAMLWMFVIFNILVAAVALSLEGTENFGDLDRWILLLGLPAAFTGTGLFAVLLLASDLSGKMRRLASRDPLTGVLNRRGFEEQATLLIANAVRHRQPLALALADLDRFKAVNDRHGHAAGDMLLSRFAQQIDGAVRQGDIFARLGGEEFVLLLVNTTGEAAVAVIDRLRCEVATQTLPTTPPIVVTTSFGVAELRPGETSLDTLVARADRALYLSKSNGRDRVTLAPVD